MNILFYSSMCLFFLLFQTIAFGDEATDALAQKAKNILTQNCYSCHGEPGKKVKGGFDSILDFEKLRNNKDYIDKIPENSELYLRILKDEMPPGKSVKLSSEEKKIILDWINAKLPTTSSGGKLESDKQDSANRSYVEEIIAKDLSKAPESKKPSYRYLSIAHMVGAGDSEKDINVFRDAMTKLVNSLSFEKTAKPLVAIDDKRLVFRIDLNDYGWNKNQRRDKKDVWDALAQSNPYNIYGNDVQTLKIKKDTETSFPFLRGDWFAIAASQPRFYHQFLNLPDTDSELENMLGIDVNKNVASGLAHRAGFTDSGVSSNNRIIERHKSPFGAYWKSYDFGDSVGTSDILNRPLGAGDGPSEFKHAGGEIIFNLPNGLQAYLLVDSKHQRLSEAPVAIVHDTTKLNSTIVNGSSCMSCHSQGMKVKYDKIREHVLENKDLYSEKDLRQILSLYKENDQLKDAFSEDSNRFIEAMKKSGVQNLTGDEPVRYLTDRFEQRVNLKRAAAELGVTEETLIEKSKTDKDARSIVTRLKDGGGVPREFFVANFNKLKEIIDREVKVEPKKIIEKEICYETRDIWEYDFGKSPVFKTFNYVGEKGGLRITALGVYNDLIVVGGGNGKIHQLDFALDDNYFTTVSKGEYKDGRYSSLNDPLILNDGSMIASSADDHIYFLDVNRATKKKIKLDEPWVMPGIPFQHPREDGVVFFSQTARERLVGKPVQLKNGDLVFPTSRGQLLFASSDGKLKLKATAENVSIRDTDGFNLKSSPVVTATNQIAIGSIDGNLYLFNSDGSLKTKFATKGPITSTPTVMKDGTIVVGSSDRNVYFLNSDATLKKKVTLGGEVSGKALILNDGSVVIGSSDRKLNFIKPNGDLKSINKITTDAAPVQMKDGTIVVGSQVGIVYFFNPDGTEKARYENKSIENITREVTVLNDDSIILTGTNGLVLKIKISKEKLKTGTITVEVPCSEKSSKDELRIFDSGRSETSKHENAPGATGVKKDTSKQK